MRFPCEINFNDIAVDTLGRAWVFRGLDELNMTNLDVYDSGG